MDAREHSRRRSGLALAALLVATACIPAAHARVAIPRSLADLTHDAERIVRGRCVAAEIGSVEVAGARLQATTYTFVVSEELKGPHAGTISFRQLGTPAGGPRDLGTLAGLPTYAPGTEYVLFLLPESAAGLTSPAGAGDGAFVVEDDRVRQIHGRPLLSEAGRAGAPPGVAAPLSYEALRRAVQR